VFIATKNYNLYNSFELALILELTSSGTNYLTLLGSRTDFLRERLEMSLVPLLQFVLYPTCGSFELQKLSNYGRTTKDTHFHKLCLFSLFVTVDIYLNLSVTKEFPYALLREHRIDKRRLVEPIPQKRLFVVP
jgi:hypothetical protein